MSTTQTLLNVYIELSDLISYEKEAWRRLWLEDIQHSIHESIQTVRGMERRCDELVEDERQAQRVISIAGSMALLDLDRIAAGGASD